MKKSPVYFRDGKLVMRSGEVRVYDLNNELFMELGRQNLISSDKDLSEYIWQLSDKPFGNCLVIGLGLGIASKYLLSFSNVKSVTVIEEYDEIIEVQTKINPIDDTRFKVLNEAALTYLYKTDKTYDFIFLDYHTVINEWTFPIIADTTLACKKVLVYNGVLLGWLSNNTPEVFIDSFFELFNT